MTDSAWCPACQQRRSAPVFALDDGACNECGTVLETLPPLTTRVRTRLRGVRQ